MPSNASFSPRVDNESTAVFVLFITFIILFTFLYLKLIKIAKNKIYRKYFMVFASLLGLQLIIFALILVDLREISESGSSCGWAACIKGAGILFGSIMSIINFFVLSLVYKKSEGLK